jgi:hypothetical protein
MLTCHQLGLGPKETPWLLARSRATRMRAAGHAEAARPAEKPLPPPADTAACYMLEALNAAPSPTSPKESLAVVHVHGPSPGRGMAMATYAASTPCILLQSKEYEKEHCRERRGDAVGGRHAGHRGHHHFRRIRRARRSPAAPGHMPVAASASQDLDHNSHKSARGEVVNSIHNHKQRDQ